MKQIIDLNNWDRANLFQHFNSCTNPFIFITSEIDITKLYKFAKNNKLSMYASITFFILDCVNNIDEFRYRIDKNNIVLYDKVNANFTDNNNGNNIFFFTVNSNNNLIEFNKKYKKIKKDCILNNKTYSKKEYDLNEIWVSCSPWLKYNSIIPPYDQSYSIPQFIWDKFEKKDDKITTNLMIMVHHGFLDGYQIGEFLKMLQDKLNNI